MPRFAAFHCVCDVNPALDNAIDARKALRRWSVIFFGMQRKEEPGLR
jgi:hypothetical protein